MRVRVYVYQREDEEEVKCPHCNWRVSRIYFLAKDDKEAEEFKRNIDRYYEKDEYDEDVGIFCCGECLAEYLSVEAAKIEF